MQETIPTTAPAKPRWLSRLVPQTRSRPLTLTDWVAAFLTSVLLVLSFPDFNLWPLAWVALVPLLVVIARKPRPLQVFLLGWLSGSIFFYATCHWLTFSMINYGGLPAWISYLLLVPGALGLGLFPAVFAFGLARVIRCWGLTALLLSPLLWVPLEWARLGLTGQLWNAIGYSQAYHPQLIQTAQWGGVYAVGFLIVTVNAVITFLLFQRSTKALLLASVVLAAVVGLMFGPYLFSSTREIRPMQSTPDAVVIALQPNVPVKLIKSTEELKQLTARHITMSEDALGHIADHSTPRLVIWPESPMNFTYAIDSHFREFVGAFAKTNDTSVLFNSQEPAPNEGSYNSAMLVDKRGSLIAQYDKIRLLPFGEYVPLPNWLPGASLIRAIVGDFTAGTKYTLMPVGAAKAGVFICIESAYPSIARRFASEGADVLINISNDGYLGPTAVMRQHLANAVFRAVENGRPLLRVTNTGITAYITPRGEIRDATSGFQVAVRTWTITRSQEDQTFYTKHGDMFVALTAVIGFLIFAASFLTHRAYS